MKAQEQAREWEIPTDRWGTFAAYQEMLPGEVLTNESVRAEFTRKYGRGPDEVRWVKPGMWLAGPVPAPIATDSDTAAQPAAAAEDLVSLDVVVRPGDGEPAAAAVDLLGSLDVAVVTTTATGGDAAAGADLWEVVPTSEPAPMPEVVKSFYKLLLRLAVLSPEARAAVAVAVAAARASGEPTSEPTQLKLLE